MSEFRDEFRSASREARWAFWRIVGWFAVPALFFSVLAVACGWFGEAAQVTREEFGPKGGLRKYEWFKEASAQLQKKRADIEVYRARVAKAEARAATGDRTDRERLSVMEAELAGVVASYNSLAADYNAASSKFNWGPFKGEVPETVVPYNEGSQK